MTSPSPPAELAQIKAACCLLESDAGVGTGYLVGDLIVATCAHVVGSLKRGEVIKARFGDSGRQAFVAAVVDQVEAKADCALLKLREPLPGVTPLLLADVTPEDHEWLAYGFPAFADGLGVPLSGSVMDRDAFIPGNLRGLALFSPILGAHPPASIGGFSGSPVLCGARVVGHLSSVLGAKGALKQPHLGYAYAAPAQGVRALLGLPAPIATSLTRAPISEATVAQLSDVFSRLQFASSGTEVLSWLESVAPANDALRLYAAEMLLGFALPKAALKVLGEVSGQRARELTALALSLDGQAAKASALAAMLPITAEAGGIAGGILKRRWLATRNTAHLRSAFFKYFEAYEATSDHYPGVNAAACALYLGEVKESRRLAEEVAASLRDKERGKWEQASYAEACLLLSEVELARTEYQKAAALLGTGTRHLAVMRAQAIRNLKYLKVETQGLEPLLPRTKRAAAFTGHRISANFPEDRVAFVRDRIHDAIEEQDIGFGYCSAAGGADLLFIEALLDRELEVQVFLPFPKEHFKDTSVGPDKLWLARFDDLMERLGPHRVTELSDSPPNQGDDTPYVLCNAAIHRAARAQANVLFDAPMLLAVVAASSEGLKRAPGGAADAIRAWQLGGDGEVLRIDPVVEPAKSHATAAGANGAVPPGSVGGAVPPVEAVATPNQRQVFVSYKHDEPWSRMAQELDLKLRNMAPTYGYEVFFDRRMESGVLWSDAIDEALDVTTHFIVLLSDPYWASKECQRELQCMVRRYESAKRDGKPPPHLLFVLAGDVDAASLTLDAARKSGTLSSEDPQINRLSDVNFLGPYDLNGVGKLEILDWSDKQRLERQLGQLRDRFKVLLQA